MIVKWENDMKTDEFRIEEEEDDFNGDLENSFIQELWFLICQLAYFISDFFLKHWIHL